MPNICKPFWESLDALTCIVKKATSFSNVFTLLGVRGTAARHRMLRSTLITAGVTTEHFRGKFQWSDEIVIQAVADSCTWGEVAQRLGVKGGGSHQHVRMRAEKAGASWDHFRGLNWSKGLKRQELRRNLETILQVQPKDEYKIRTKVLRQALLDSGHLHQCACGQGPFWHGQPLVLQIDHINGDRFDHRKENLRFICPNCHTQTPTYGNKGRSSQ